ncbi:uncharacterized protein RCC_05972 [Ramularia collo-cygni]|uniref:Uncharacterized protein n=1 Tax=Ramularia collo-cygni TaxID=112498 RepID=A0A2D3V072_9PEZI|nr:uncharacterized protein RCC_05972 [Ramularia collo-cygni]CZT20115.1 uncharacterized protein RCC_05972 [Ramularia collo-cygni]
MSKSRPSSSAPTDAEVSGKPTSSNIIRTISLPSNHPPYESPIDGRFPMHFDTSGEFHWYFHSQSKHPIGKKFFSTKNSDFLQRMLTVTSSMTPPLHVSLRIETCITAMAKVFDPENPEVSPPMFVFEVQKKVVGQQLTDGYHALRRFLEAEVPREEFPELYQDGRIILRFLRRDYGGDIGMLY